MALTDDLLRCAESYCEARKIALPTLSTQILNDGRTFDRIAAGGSLTVRNFERCMVWLSAHWPDDTAWPEGIERPDPIPASTPAEAVA